MNYKVLNEKGINDNVSDDIKMLFDNNIYMLQKFEIAEFFLKRQNIIKYNMYISECISNLEAFGRLYKKCEKYLKCNKMSDEFVLMLLELFEIKKQKNDTYFVTYFKTKILDIIRDVQNEIICTGMLEDINEEHSEKNDIYRNSRNGKIILEVNTQKEKKKINSESSLLEAELSLVNSWYEENKSRYIIYGIGMSYHIWLMEVIDESIDIEVYDANSDYIALSQKYSECNLSGTINKINIFYDPNLQKLEKTLLQKDEQTKFLVYYPALNYINSKDIRDKIIQLDKIYGNCENYLTL